MMAGSRFTPISYEDYLAIMRMPNHVVGEALANGVPLRTLAADFMARQQRRLSATLPIPPTILSHLTRIRNGSSDLNDSGIGDSDSDDDIMVEWDHPIQNYLNYPLEWPSKVKSVREAEGLYLYDEKELDNGQVAAKVFKHFRGITQFQGVDDLEVEREMFRRHHGATYFYTLPSYTVRTRIEACFQRFLSGWSSQQQSRGTLIRCGRFSNFDFSSSDVDVTPLLDKHEEYITPAVTMGETEPDGWLVNTCIICTIATRDFFCLFSTGDFFYAEKDRRSDAELNYLYSWNLWRMAELRDRVTRLKRRVVVEEDVEAVRNRQNDVSSVGLDEVQQLIDGFRADLVGFRADLVDENDRWSRENPPAAREGTSSEDDSADAQGPGRL
jgi:hypothetical protein